jgi:DNA-directed RNA polymerase subunit RPC12/RpoP
MSSPDLRGSQLPTDGGRTSGRRKAVLFCQSCGHESLVGGDWIATDDYLSRTRHVRCPECETTVADRPLPTDSAADEAPPADDVEAGPFGRTVETVARLWQHSMRRWMQWSRRADA